MKSVIEINRHYYKYIYSTFTQPTLTENGTFGGNQMAVSHTFGGNNSSWGTTYTAFSPNTSGVGFYCNEWKSSMYFCIYLPKPTRLTSLTFFIPYTGSSSGGAYNTLFYGGNGANDRKELIRNIGTIGENGTCNVALTSSSYYQYYTLYFENGGHSYEDQVEIRNIKIAGESRTVVDGAINDYDYYIDTYKCQTPLINNEYKAYKF